MTGTAVQRLLGVTDDEAAGLGDQIDPRVDEFCELLTVKLRVEQIPRVARRPAAAYGSLSMIEMLCVGRADELLRNTRASFDWATGA